MMAKAGIAVFCRTVLLASPDRVHRTAPFDRRVINRQPIGVDQVVASAEVGCLHIGRILALSMAGILSNGTVCA